MHPIPLKLSENDKTRLANNPAIATRCPGWGAAGLVFFELVDLCDHLQNRN